jgi:hypothetical protein
MKTLHAYEGQWISLNRAIKFAPYKLLFDLLTISSEGGLSTSFEVSQYYPA